eukprot:TRINITY_DN47330_c0_g1_i1.p1 TRINITY_DN47330_c0_g1~~TRINITY_DN47330_c0_g1_i1.p1  ORF type:complete len:283 (+),score=66.82 TRINITY_DN47330_c0_g1_i1:75-923(+)
MVGPACPKGHELEAKEVAGSSWFGFASPKKCSGCDIALTQGTTRHSCKQCSYHLCPACHAAVVEALAASDITLTVLRLQQPGICDEDTLQVEVERCATVGALKEKLGALYSLPPPLQVIRRDAGGPALADAEPVACEDGDVILLEMRSAMEALLDPAAMGDLQNALGNPLQELAGAMEAALAAQAANSAAEETAILEGTTYSLVFVLRLPGVEEKRCSLEVAALANVSEVVDMVKLELNAETHGALTLEFAGERLPTVAPVHTFGLTAGDILFVVPEAAAPG